MIKERIKELARNWAPDTIAIRHYLHANPELSYQEFNTSLFVQEKLKSYGIPYRAMAGTGIVALLEGKNPAARVVALRADMDALPIAEENDVPYRSTKPGVMHACGHDVHTSILLGAARILNELKSQWGGTVKLIFQPGEEKNPGGASLMIADGVLKDPAPEAIFGLHVHPGLEVGKYSFRGGVSMASADELYISIRGKGGHASTPQTTVDTILTAAQLVVQLQEVISRNRNPLSPSVLSITSVQGGHTTNVIPAEVKLMGTFRAMDEAWRAKAHDCIRRIAAGLALASGAEIDVHIDIGYPVVVNDENLYPRARSAAEAYAGAENVSETEVRLGSEDFGYYTQAIPGCFYRLGVMNAARGITSGVHTPTFNIDEAAIENGVGMMAWLGATVVP